MTGDQIVAVIAALAGLLGAMIEYRRAEQSERIARVEERVSALERK